jgi:hypothetical protein
LARYPEWQDGANAHPTRPTDEEGELMRMTLRSRSARLAGALAMVALLALAGCGAPAPHTGSAGAGDLAGQDASIQEVQSASVGVQSLTGALLAAQTDANLDYASQENETQP